MGQECTRLIEVVEKQEVSEIILVFLSQYPIVNILTLLGSILLFVVVTCYSYIPGIIRQPITLAGMLLTAVHIWIKTTAGIYQYDIHEVLGSNTTEVLIGISTVTLIGLAITGTKGILRS